MLWKILKRAETSNDSKNDSRIPDNDTTFAGTGRTGPAVSSIPTTGGNSPGTFFAHLRVTLRSIAVKSLIPNRLAHRLIISLTVVIVVAEGISGYLSVRTEEELLLNSMITGVDQLSRAITSATWHAMLADNREAAYEVMQTIATKQGIDRIRIFNKEGRIMFSTREEQSQQVDKKAEECYLCHATDEPMVRVDVPGRSRTYHGTDGGRRLALVTPIYNEPSCSDAICHAHPASISVLGVLDVSLELATVDSEIAAVQRRAALNTLINVVLVGLVIVVFTRLFVDRPIHQLIEATRSVRAMKLDTPVTISTRGELGELARSFDLMREELRSALESLNSFAQELETKVDERTRQLRLAHQKLLQSDRLASLGQLSASVAHEINNPIAGVLNLTMLMQRIMTDNGIPPDRVGDFRDYLRKASTETARVGRIVTDLLAFSRRSKGQRSHADLNAIVQSTLSIIDHKLSLMNVSMDLRLAPDLARVYCDASQMQQVIINLIMNAAEAMQAKGGGPVVVSTGTDRSENAVVLTVSDSGDGIPPDVRGKIFDPFFTTKEEGKGVGLGLAVVYGIIQAHHGDIHVDTEPGKGTRFVVTLPCDNGSDVGAKEPHA